MLAFAIAAFVFLVGFIATLAVIVWAATLGLLAMLRATVLLIGGFVQLAARSRPR
jgi:hypothetical protein